MSDYEEFLDSTMVGNGNTIVLLNEGEFKEPEETGLSRTVFQIQVQVPDGRKKTWSMNKTTRKKLAHAWGDDSSNWVNRKVKIQITQQNVRGEIKDVIYGTPTDAFAEPPSKQDKIDQTHPKLQVDAIINDIVTAKPENTVDTIKKMIEEQKKYFGGMVTEEAAAILVATNLGIYKEGRLTK
jgi:uncharacterized FAD-dependent dehydrogenase